mmetsp:Transcript_22259/g.69278  ORF Transcript_22259/g.69278 Transcript_22259/m.69278 type:complete len:372 (+) Transcript_22259:1960-3075(+)
MTRRSIPAWSMRQFITTGSSTSRMLITVVRPTGSRFLDWTSYTRSEFMFAMRHEKDALVALPKSRLAFWKQFWSTFLSAALATTKKSSCLPIAASTGYAYFPSLTRTCFPSGPSGGRLKRRAFDWMCPMNILTKSGWTPNWVAYAASVPAPPRPLSESFTALSAFWTCCLTPATLALASVTPSIAIFAFRFLSTSSAVACCSSCCSASSADSRCIMSKFAWSPFSCGRSSASAMVLSRSALFSAWKVTDWLMSSRVTVAFLTSAYACLLAAVSSSCLSFTPCNTPISSVVLASSSVLRWVASATAPAAFSSLASILARISGNLPSSCARQSATFCSRSLTGAQAASFSSSCTSAFMSICRWEASSFSLTAM